MLPKSPITVEVTMNGLSGVLVKNINTIKNVTIENATYKTPKINSDNKNSLSGLVFFES
jgi:hypothetical protein